MAEGLALTASIVAILQLSGAVVNVLATAYAGTEDRNEIMAELSSITGVLFHLKDLVERSQSDGSWPVRMVSLASLPSQIAYFQSVLDGLYLKVKPVAGLRAIDKFLRWPFQKKQSQDILAALGRQKSDFLLCLGMDHLNLSKKIGDSIITMKSEIEDMSAAIGKVQSSVKEEMSLISGTISKVYDGQQRITTEKEFLKVLDWLSPLTFEAKQDDIFERRQAGTGEWFLQSNEFQNWLLGSLNCLWCTASPGAGKTIMASIAINFIEKVAAANNIAVAYIYFHYDETKDQTAINIIGSLVRQLLQTRAVIPDQILSLYKEYSKTNRRLNLTNTVKLLHSECLFRHKTFIIVDALNECSVNNGTQENVLNVLSRLPPSTHLMLTSRSDIAVVEKIPNAVQLEIRATNTDIATYIETRLKEDSLLKRHIGGDTELKALITTRLIENAKGLFLLPQLHLNSFNNMLSKSKIKLSLNNLSQDLGPIYEKAIAMIRQKRPDEFDLAKRVLSWIFYAPRPMGVEEVQHALAVESNQRYFDWDGLIDPETILSVCAGLIIIDRERNIMCLSHQTVQEHLQSIQNDFFPEGQEDITRTCLTYLCFDLFAAQTVKSEEKVLELSLTYPLLPYAAQNWGFHANLAPENSIRDLILSFLENAPELVYVAMHSLKYRYGASGRRIATNAPRLQTAASFGLEKTVEALIENGDDINALSEDGYTALGCAAWSGHEAVVRLLLDKKAEIEAKNSSGWSALAYACRNEHVGVVRELLARGADIETKNLAGWTPLIGAAWNGHESIIRLLLANNANIEARNGAGWTSLHQVAGHGNHVLTSLLLSMGALPDSKSSWGWTPLMSAAIAKSGGQDTVRVLLDAGSDRAAKDTRGETAHDKARQHGKVSIMELLA
ncbi:hypothetical protein V493_06811 [Pseudogymnoascus sp. VKM F-4281 (FW-2241)]|nr:hypothetical protein V493_06811 [Pseudogymnoascus sp. VKM F-4281 (FW-2241)]